MLQTAAAGSRMRRWLIPGPTFALLLAAAFIAWQVEGSGEALGAVGIVLGGTVAGALVIRRSNGLSAQERAAWRFIAVGVLLVAAGVLAVAVLGGIGVEVPAFGLLDIFFLGGYASLVVALYRLARHDPNGRDWLITIMDALVGAISLSALVWFTFLHDLIDTFVNAAWWELAIAMTYPVLDIASVIGIMILVLRRSHYHFDLRLVFLAAGMTIQVLADFIYLSSGIGRTFAEADPSFPLNLLATGFLVMTAAIIDRTPRRREFPDQEAPLWAMLWPYLLAAALLTTHVALYRALGPDSDERLLLDALIAIGLVVFLRQVIVIHRNRMRVENQRSELVASVSHELRTPLTAMVGFLTLLEESGDDFPVEARREMLSEATDQARHMSRLVSDLVMLARGNHHRLPVELSESPVAPLMTAALRSVEPEHTRIEGDYDIDAEVMVDSDRVQQALANLLSNAVRYGGDHALLAGRVDGDSLVLEVHDNGDGVPVRHHTTIWQRFERGAHRLNATTPGLGIGLAIVRAVAEAHGGRAEYRRSERLDGACFSLIIPGCVISRREPQVRIEVAR